MSENINSSEGALEDLLRTFVHLACTEEHLKANLTKNTADMELGKVEIDEFNEIEEDILSDLFAVTELRRNVELRLYSGAGGDPENPEPRLIKKWCMLKHLAIATFTAFEYFQSTQDINDYDTYFKINKLFTKSVSAFLGITVTSCASCFSDFLKAKGAEVENNKEDSNGM